MCKHQHYAKYIGGVWWNWNYVCDTMLFLCWDCGKDLGTLALHCKDKHENHLIFFPLRKTLTQDGKP